MVSKFFKFLGSKLFFELMILNTLFFFSLIVFSNNSFDFYFYHNGDVHRGFHRGLDVWAGTNSYESFNPTNMLTQEKVPGFFPVYFYLMAFFVYLADFSFIKFIDILRIFTFFFYSSIGILIYLNLRRYGIIIAFISVIFFMFNRWTLFDVISLKQESYVLLLVLISYLILDKNKSVAFFIFGLATSIKHLTILILPIFYLYAYKDIMHKDLLFQSKKLIILSLIFLFPIIIPSVSYFLDDSDKFYNSIFFNVTREPESIFVSNYIVGLDKTLVLYNQDNMNDLLLVLPRLPLVFLLILINVLLLRGLIDKWSYAFLTYFSFVSFNPVLFGQYMVWFLLFLAFIFPKLFEKIKK